MKKIAAAIALIFLFTGCHKNDEHWDKAVLLGYDMSNCACCGGMLVAFGDSLQTGGTIFRVDQLPANTELIPLVKYPVKVFIEWQNDTTPVCNNTKRIIITKLVKR